MRFINLISTFVLLLFFCTSKAHNRLISAQTKDQFKTNLFQKASKKYISVSNTGKISKIKRKRKSRLIEVGFEFCCFALTTPFFFHTHELRKVSNDFASYSYYSNQERGPPAGVKV